MNTRELFENQKEFDGKCPLCGARTCSTFSSNNAYRLDICLKSNEGCGVWQGNYKLID